MSTFGANPFSHLEESFTQDGNVYKYFDLPKIDNKYDALPFSIRILLESAVRNCDNFHVLESDVKSILNWTPALKQGDSDVEVSFKPARVILQDFTGVPAVVDFAAMRDAVLDLGGNPEKINPICPADLVVDHSVQVDFARTTDALAKNQSLEFERNKERFTFLKWGAQAFNNMLIVPPGSGIVHQVNLEYLARVVFETDATDGTKILYPDSVNTLSYMRQTNRSEKKIHIIREYLKATRQLRDYALQDQDPTYTESVTLDLSTVVTSVSGPKRPHDRVSVSSMFEDFKACLTSPVGFKGFAVPPDALSASGEFQWEDGKSYKLRHGSVVIAAITSCTNTSNPSVMLGAGLLAKNAVEKGLSILPYIKTSLSPGSGVVTYYLKESGVIPYLEQLGFDIVGYGCMTCIGNSGPLEENVVNAIEKNGLVCCGVLSGNRNFEGRIHPNTRANYLASPLLVIAYAIAGRVDIDFETQPLGVDGIGKSVFLRDIWPTRSQIQEVERKHVIPAMFQEVYSKIKLGSEDWQTLEVSDGKLYPWSAASTYIKRPPFFEGMTRQLPKLGSIEGARCLLFLGDSVTTDHISPAGSIARNSPAARYLAERHLTPRDFNSYGSRRGNDAVMARGTFANIRLVNKLASKTGPRTVHMPSQQDMDIFDAAERYRQEGTPLLLIVGKDYGSGSSRDWAAKGPFLLGIKAVIAESYERIHRSNLVGMGVIPLQFLPGQSADSLHLTGREMFNITLPKRDDLRPGQRIQVNADGNVFETTLRFDTEVDITYYKNGGILNYMIRKMLD
ncbi:blast:Cytoplasmic aconitate hydratase [Drosophila guanche]|uniref:aconitate hydratase n=1 Tax=Drosophila guanche TaxID=7266 RepID=A0A3B0JL94_DROGU|nr:blast:Cytoplasmic aconitate hydratase [Drosophila guanche]